MTEAQLATILRHAVLSEFAIAGGTANCLGPSDGNPEIEFSYDKYESKIHEEGNNVQPVANIMTAKKATVKITTKNIDLAMDMINAIDVGQDIYDGTTRAGLLTMTPIGVESGTVLSFTNAYFDPTLSYTPKAGEDHTATLAFVCFPDSETGKVFTWPVVST